jgi:hypothetical protein
MATRYAVIKQGKVVNVILADEAFVRDQGLNAVPSDVAGPGWTWDGTAFTPPPPPPPPPPSQRELDRQDALAKLDAAVAPTAGLLEIKAALAAVRKVL